MNSMREHFLLDPDVVYLNHGSFGACSRPAFDTYQALQRELERNPMAFLARESGQRLAAARQCLADELGARADDLVFVPNATHGVNAVAHSLGLREGDEVLTTDLEYGACVATFERACRDGGATLRRVATTWPFEPDDFVSNLLAAATERTRLVFCSHITSSTALVLPVEALCKRARALGIPTLIDGAHGPGQLAIDLDAMAADYYAGAAHKWLCAPKGSAFLHVRAPHPPWLRGNITSWGQYDEAAGHPLISAITGTTALQREFQWQGTRDLAAFLAVPSAIAFQCEHDWQNRRRECHELVTALQARVLSRNGLSPLADPSQLAQMVAVPVRCADAAKLQDWLRSSHGIEVLATSHGERPLLRVSVQAYNDDAQLHELDRALQQAGA